MACRFKDFLYLGVIILLTMGVWYSYSPQPSTEEKEDQWDWMDDSQTYRAAGDYLDGTGQEQEFFYGGADHGFDDNTEQIAEDGYAEIAGLEGNFESPHLPLNDFWDTQKLLNPESFPVAIPQKDESEDQQIWPQETASENIKEHAVLDLKIAMETSQPIHLQAPLAVLALPPVEEEVLVKPVASLVQPPQPLQTNTLVLPELIVPGREEDKKEPWTHFEENSGQRTKPRIVLRSMDSVNDDSGETSIPRIIHQAWDVTDIPMSFSPFVQTWLVRNPGWEYWFWTPNDVKALIDSNYPQFSNMFASDELSVVDRANVMRYFIIHAHGGVFAELDMECLKSINTWTVSNTCFLVEEPREHSYLINNKLEGNVINALMACVPHHPFYEVILHALPEYIKRYHGDDKHATGSFFVDEIFRAFRKHPLPESLTHYGEVALIEPEYFIPRYDESNWAAINSACNTNIIDMPFHVSWLCTVWIRNRMQQNNAYPQSYTDHHWIDVESEFGLANIATVPIMSVIKSVLPDANLPRPVLPTVIELENVASAQHSSAQQDIAPEAQKLAALLQQQQQQQQQPYQQQPPPPPPPQPDFGDQRQIQDSSYLSLLRQNIPQHVAPLPLPGQVAPFPSQQELSRLPPGYQSDSRLTQSYPQTDTRLAQQPYRPPTSINNVPLPQEQYGIPAGVPAPARSSDFPKGEVYPEGFAPNSAPAQQQVFDPSQGIPQPIGYRPT